MSQVFEVKQFLPVTSTENEYGYRISARVLAFDAITRQWLIAIYTEVVHTPELSGWSVDLAYVGGHEYESSDLSITHWMDLPDRPIKG